MEHAPPEQEIKNTAAAGSEHSTCKELRRAISAQHVSMTSNTKKMTGSGGHQETPSDHDTAPSPVDNIYLVRDTKRKVSILPCLTKQQTSNRASHIQVGVCPLAICAYERKRLGLHSAIMKHFLFRHQTRLRHLGARADEGRSHKTIESSYKCAAQPHGRKSRGTRHATVPPPPRFKPRHTVQKWRTALGTIVWCRWRLTMNPIIVLRFLVAKFLLSSSTHKRFCRRRPSGQAVDMSQLCFLLPPGTCLHVHSA